jgi:hypothetical protein
MARLIAEPKKSTLINRKATRNRVARALVHRGVESAGPLAPETHFLDFITSSSDKVIPRRGALRATVEKTNDGLRVIVRPEAGDEHFISQFRTEIVDGMDRLVTDNSAHLPAKMKYPSNRAAGPMVLDYVKRPVPKDPLLRV